MIARYLEQGLAQFWQVDPDECKALIDDLRQKHPQISERELADQIAKHFAHKAAWRGFWTGLPSNLILAPLLVWMDTRGTSRFRAAMAASLRHLSDAQFFERDDWQEEVLSMLAHDQAQQQGQSRFVKHASRFAAQRWLSEQGQRWTQRKLAAWLGKRAAGAAFATKLVPVLGGIIGACWNYAELQLDRRWLIRNYFDAAQSSAALSLPAPSKKDRARS